MTERNTDMKALETALKEFTRTSAAMEESYRRLQERVQELDQKLAAKNRELAETRDYLDSILECMSDGVIAVDSSGTVTKFNHNASVILGYDAAEAVGRPFKELFGRAFETSPTRRAVELRVKSGALIPVSERDSPLYDRTRHRIGTVKVFQDLTEIEALRQQVRQKDRLAALGEMAATVAHEIRNPLGGIRGFAALLARDLADDEAGSRIVGKILNGVSDLDRFVTELLEYTRPIELQLRTVSCAELVHDALEYTGLDGERIEVREDISPTLFVLADAHQLRHALLNVLLNARDSIEGTGAITASSEIDATTVTIVVADTGVGMLGEQQEKAFSPFFTTKEKGTGLGLAMTAKVIEGHGGLVELASEPGKGTTVRMRLPRAEHHG